MGKIRLYWSTDNISLKLIVSPNPADAFLIEREPKLKVRLNRALRKQGEILEKRYQTLLERVLKELKEDLENEDKSNS